MGSARIAGFGSGGISARLPVFASTVILVLMPDHFIDREGWLSSQAEALTLAEIVTIGEGFRAGTFPGADYHHREHLITTIYLLRTYPEQDWRSELPDMIRRYNEAQGGVNSETAGYHCTITMFYLEQIEEYLAANAELGLVDACAGLIASPLVEKDHILQFYSRERLFSKEARRQFIPADLADDLPGASQ